MPSGPATAVPVATAAQPIRARDPVEPAETAAAGAKRATAETAATPDSAKRATWAVRAARAACCPAMAATVVPAPWDWPAATAGTPGSAETAVPADPVASYIRQ